MNEQWFQWAREGGAYLSPFLLGALVWMNFDRNRLLAELKVKSDKVDELAERIIVVATKLQMFLFNRGGAE